MSMAVEPHTHTASSPCALRSKAANPFVCSWCEDEQVSAAALLDGRANYGICAPCLRRCLKELESVRPSSRRNDSGGLGSRLTTVT
jgi:hypothetical protein